MKPDFEIVSDAASLWALKDDWDELYERADKPHFSQSFHWNWCGWEAIARPRKGRLHCLVVRTHARPLLIWPLVIHRHRNLWRLARPLGSEATEYSDVLVDAALESSSVMALAWQKLRRTCHADIIRLPCIRTDSPLYRLMARESAPAVRGYPALSVIFEGYQSWDSYYRSLSGTFRSGLNRKRRRLTQRGNLTFQLIMRGEEYQSSLNWILHQKRLWVIRKNYDAPRFHCACYRKFLYSIVNNGDINGKIAIFVLKVGEHVVAAELSSIDNVRVEMLICTFDPDYGRYSPGQLLNEFCLKWAFEQGLIYDFRIGDEEYKRTWANRTCEMFDYEFANSAWGALYETFRNVLLRTKKYVRSA